MAARVPGSNSYIRWILAIAVLAIANSAYLASVNTPSIFYHANVVLHVVLGLPLAAAILLMSGPALLKSARRSGGVQGLLLRTLAATAMSCRATPAGSYERRTCLSHRSRR